MNEESVERIVVVAIVVLLVVFVGSLVALIVICYQRRDFLKKDFFTKNFSEHHYDNAFLIANHSGKGGSGSVKKHGKELELDDVRLHPNIDQILSDTQWVDDATGLIPHCLAVLKGCHHLTERLVAATMSAMPRFNDAEQRVKLHEIGRIAPTISPRVDDVVEAMYPPLDPRLLESRCLSLLLSVSRFAIVITYTCAIRGRWIDDELKGLEMQLKILRDAGQALINSEVSKCSETEAEEKAEVTPVSTDQASSVSTDKH